MAGCTLATRGGQGSCHSSSCSQKKGAEMALGESYRHKRDTQTTHYLGHDVAEESLENYRPCSGSSETADIQEFGWRSPGLADDHFATILRVWEGKNWESRSFRLCERFCGP